MRSSKLPLLSKQDDAFLYLNCCIINQSWTINCYLRIINVSPHSSFYFRLKMKNKKHERILQSFSIQFVHARLTFKTDFALTKLPLSTINTWRPFSKILKTHLKPFSYVTSFNYVSGYQVETGLPRCK